MAATAALPAICGYARTAKIAAINPSPDPIETVRARRMAYYRYMAGGPSPLVAVIEDGDYPSCIGAFWGEVNATVHKGLGLQGAITNGVMRDLGDIAEGFQVLAGSVGPSHGFVHVTEIGTPVRLFGLEVEHEDLVHADRHGAVVIPFEVVGQLDVAIEKMRRTEQLILVPARQPGFDIDAFETAWAEFESARS